MPKLTGWQLVTLAAIIVPSICGLTYALVQSGQDVAGIAAAVVAILGALGWHSSRTSAKLEEVRNDVGKVEKLANGNLSRADQQRAEAQQQAIDHLHAVYQQLIQVAAAAPSGTPVPPLPAAMPASTAKVPADA